jgi:hypothetical protein
MTPRAASSPAGLRARARRGLMLAVPITLIALVVAAFAAAPTRISHRANDRTDERLLPPASPASVPPPVIDARLGVTRAAVPGGERALPRPRLAVGRWRVER